MTIYEDATDGENLSVNDIYLQLDYGEKEELMELILNENSYKSHSIYNKMSMTSDNEFLNDKKIWDYIIKMVKYHDSALLEYIIDELSYNPPKIK